MSLTERIFGISADDQFKEDIYDAGYRCLNCGFDLDEHVLRRGQHLCPKSMLSEADIQRVVKAVIKELGK